MPTHKPTPLILELRGSYNNATHLFLTDTIKPKFEASIRLELDKFWHVEKDEIITCNILSNMDRYGEILVLTTKHKEYIEISISNEKNYRGVIFLHGWDFSKREKWTR